MLKLIIVVYLSPYQVLLILEFFPARLATLPHGLDSNVTKLLGVQSPETCMSPV